MPRSMRRSSASIGRSRLKASRKKTNMFCPGCGSEQHGQYCRSCGTDLRLIRTALDKSDATAAPINSARDEIGRAIADKIREVKSTKELSKVVEDVLPGVEKFFETPEEKRLRRIRAGTVVAAIGLGVVLIFLALGEITREKAVLFFISIGLATMLIGLGLMFNGWLFTNPNRRGKEKASEPSVPPAIESIPNSIPTAAAVERVFPASVSEHTTHQLPETKTGEG
jgi:hypothetical protein